MKLAGVDVGGTFTDVIVVDTDSKAVKIHKVPSTPDDASEGLIDGLRSAGDDSMGVEFLAHGTTIATNSLLQYDGAQVGMITTRGYRDVLHIARHQRPLHYSIQMEVPWQDRALIKRRHRKVVTERLGPKGEVVTPLEEEEVATAARELKEAGVSSIVIGFLNSYRNPEHEERARSIVEEVYPGAFVTTSSSLFPQFREYERFTSAAINGFVGLKVRNYLVHLRERMQDQGVKAELRLMRSNGGVATEEFAARYPATLVLGRLRADHFLGGAMQVKRDLAENAVAQLGSRLGLSTLDAAAGIITLVNHNMANAVRSRTIQKGHDPRQFTLVAFGGAGPLHAADLARSLGVPEVIVPNYPGITSAMGLLTTDLKYDLIQNEFMLDGDADLDRLNRDFKRLDAEARAQLQRDGVPETSVQILHAADCRYVGQGYELRVPMPTTELTAGGIKKFWDDFNRLHEDEYGHAFPGNPIELVNIRVVATGRLPKMPEVPPPSGGNVADAQLDTADVYFAGEDGKQKAYRSQFYERTRLPVGAKIEGPAVLLQVDSTTLVPPGATAEVLKTGDLLIKV